MTFKMGDEPDCQSVFHIVCEMGDQSHFKLENKPCVWRVVSYHLINFGNNNKPIRQDDEGDNGVSRETLTESIG